MYIGDFIKQYRDSNGVSIEDFANKAGLTTTEIEVLRKIQDDGTVVPCSNAPNQRYCSRYGCTYAYGHGHGTDSFRSRISCMLWQSLTATRKVV